MKLISESFGGKIKKKKSEKTSLKDLQVSWIEYLLERHEGKAEEAPSQFQLQISRASRFSHALGFKSNLVDV